ncbi:MAG: prepilin-type N-terminal cleavage/methylation domain-containing protein [Candidatus Wallbacteria bacterium]|nr:prepilin-type N-terminal cleavage/methylation domain-containing protein [Candidatus Wallbacteria bacterium]
MVSACSLRFGFSFIELLTVVAMIAVLATAALPMAASLYQRNRENALRETLLLMRMAIRDFPRNGVDDDGDGRIDEDPRGDANHDGFPGIRGLADGIRGIDVDGAGQPALLSDGRPNPDFDWRFRADEDEDGLIDEEAFPTDLNDLVSKMGILRGKVPIDPTTGEASWRVVLAKINNDGDWRSISNDTTDPTKPAIIVLGPPDMTTKPKPGLHPLRITAVLKPSPTSNPKGTSPDLKTLDPAQFIENIDEDPRDGKDNDGDGRVDEDCPEVIDVRSWNSSEASDGTKYSDW